MTRVGALLLGAGIALMPLGAQTPGWQSKAQVSASLFFGATEQRLVSTNLDVARADSTVEISGGMQFRYGEAADAEGTRSVQARSWIGTLAADAHPFDAVSPFVFGSVETSFEKRIDRRATGGAGARWAFVQRPGTRASISAALLGEHTRSAEVVSTSGIDRNRTSARWSFRAKLEREQKDRWTLTHVTFYQPALRSVDRYLVTSTTRLGLTLNERLAATLSFVDDYDSDARGRGARSNNNGHVLFGILATY